MTRTKLKSKIKKPIKRAATEKMDITVEEFQEYLDKLTFNTKKEAKADGTDAEIGVVTEQQIRKLRVDFTAMNKVSTLSELDNNQKNMYTALRKF